MTMSASKNKGTGLSGRLALAASPSFAVMALLSAADASPTLCGAGAAVLPVDHMTAMYLLMSLFHLPVWLKRTGQN